MKIPDLKLQLLLTTFLGRSYLSEIIQIASDLRDMMLPEIKLVVKSLKDNIQELRNNISDIQTENELLKKENKDLESRMAAVEQENDGLEQYSRRNSLRISGYPEDKDEHTDQVVDIASNDIDRSHRVGKFDDRPGSDYGPGAKCRTRDMGPVKRICVFEHSVMTNFNWACPAIQKGQRSGLLSEGSSWLTVCMSEQRRFWRDCADAQARLNLGCSHRR